MNKTRFFAIAAAIMLAIAWMMTKEADQQRVRADSAEARLARSEGSHMMSGADSAITCGDSVAALVAKARAEIQSAPPGDAATGVRLRGLETWSKFCHR